MVAEGKGGARRRSLLVLSSLVLIAAAAWLVWHFAYGRYRVVSDNAYVGGNVVEITPQTAGTVVSIAADDTDFVQAGQTLVELDASDAQLALEQAEAQLARTVRDIRSQQADVGNLQAQVAMRQAELTRVRADATRANTEYQRRVALKDSGAVAAEALEAAQAGQRSAGASVQSAESALKAAHQQLLARQAQVESASIAAHPAVQQAAAQLREAYLQRVRCRLPAPVSGYVAQRAAQVGGRVQPGSAVMALVPLDQLWVDVNLKEVQLRQVRIGQPVTLTADLYGDAVRYRGRVVGIASGTGGAFALLPAQNATGNWIKIVQRVPVRVALDAQQLREHPLRIGLSMRATLDIHDQSLPQLAQSPRATAAFSTAVYADAGARADEIVKAIIAANAGDAHGML